MEIEIKNKKSLKKVLTNIKQKYYNKSCRKTSQLLHLNADVAELAETV